MLTSILSKKADTRTIIDFNLLHMKKGADKFANLDKPEIVNRIALLYLT